MQKMSFNWTRFFTLAEQLYQNANGDEAFLRSSISRAYYAAYVSARNHLRDVDRISNIPRLDAHGFVVDHFDFSPDSTRQRIGKNLGQLRKIRNLADYEDEMFSLSSRSRRALSLAEEVLDD
jgi:hypothetical protein